MKEFVKIPTSKRSLSKRGLVFGVGVNDASYMTKVNGVHCPIYRRWVDMLRRCYSASFHADNHTYSECYACDEWLLFSKFSDWMILQDFTDKQLDKDLKFIGNKVYSPETCLFISPRINNFLLDCPLARGHYHLGVNLDSGKFKASITESGKRKTIGRYSSESEAASAYLRRKAEIAVSLSEVEVGEVKAALLRFADITLAKSEDIANS